MPRYHTDKSRLYDEHLCTLRPKRNEPRAAANIFELIFSFEKFRRVIQISLNCVPNNAINNLKARVSIMAWNLTCDKPLF